MEYLITYPDDVTEIVDIDPNNLSEAIAVDRRWLRTREGLDINLHNVWTIEQASGHETATRPRVSEAAHDAE